MSGGQSGGSRASPGNGSSKPASVDQILEGLVLSALVISFIVFACVLGSSVVGMYVRSVLPEHHVNEDSKYIFKSGMGLLATLAALVSDC